MTLRLAGPFAVVRDGEPADSRAIGSRKARLLLQVLAVHRGRLLPVDQLAEALWGDQPPRRPAENVATIVSRLRSVLGATAIVGGRGGYRLGDLDVDLDEARDLLREARQRGGPHRHHRPVRHRVAARPGRRRLRHVSPDAV